MIVCHCNVITSGMILNAIDQLYAEDPWRQLTPGRIYQHLGQRPNCGGCFPTVIAMIIEKSGLAREGSDLNPEALQALRDLLAADPMRIDGRAEETAVNRNRTTAAIAAE